MACTASPWEKQYIPRLSRPSRTSQQQTRSKHPAYSHLQRMPQFCQTAVQRWSGPHVHDCLMMAWSACSSGPQPVHPQTVSQ